jgi:hypothetical protein
VFDGMRLRMTAAGHGLASGEIPRRLASGLLTVAPRAPLGLLARRVTHQRATAFTAWSVAGGRRGASGAGAGAALATRRWRRLPTPVRERADARITECARQRARKVGTGWRSGCPRQASRRGLRRSPARRHGRRRARRPRFTREGLRRVARCVRGDQGRGVLPHPQLTMRCKTPGHGEATAARVG